MIPLPPSFPALPPFPPGEVWLTGAGPGDPRLLTLLAAHALRSADDIVHDALVDRRVLDLARDGACILYAGKRGGRTSSRQSDINELVIERARRGRRVLRLKGGDPFVFGRGGEEALALVRAGIRFRVIPGVTAGIAAAGLAGIPLTTREINHAVVLVAGHRAADGASAVDWQALARTGQPLVLYMPMAQLDEIAAGLRRGGLAADTPCAIIQAASTDAEAIVVTRLAEVARAARTHAISSPAVIVIGDNVGLRQEIASGISGWT
jgi:uroporphyrin-III C-methyltransferase